VSNQHQEFPIMAPGARAAHDAAINAIQNGNATISCADLRRALASSLREAMRQAEKGYGASPWDRLEDIAGNLHSPPPAPPTLAQAREADMDTPAGKATVTAFLATLGEGEP
jgi:hypothetical protein